MTISILNSISEADAKALLAKLLGEAETAKPESPKGKRGFAPKNDDWRAGEASYPQKMKLITFGDEKVWNPEGVALTGYWEGGDPLTFGELFTVEDRGGKRHFPVLWTGLTAGEASDIYPVLKALPDRPEADMPKRKPKASSGYKPKASAQPKADDDLRHEVAVLKALMMQLAEGQFAQPAKPVADAGVTKVPAKPGRAKAQSASPIVAYDDHGQPVSEADLMAVDLAEGQIVRWEGQLFKLTRQANGRIGQQRIG